MISFNYETSFELADEQAMRDWIAGIAHNEGREIGGLNYIFCSDEYLHKINLKFLNHDTYTDVIGFDYSVGKKLQADVYVSIDRVRANALELKLDEASELRRVMVHGLLHFCGYNDKDEAGRKQMREREDHYLLTSQ